MLSRSLNTSRRTLLKHMTALPLMAGSAAPLRVLATDRPAYTPAFFTSAQWDFVNAACDLLIPADDEGPGAVETGVPEFLDRHMQTPYAAGDIWYTQGPFFEASDDFGYQGRLVLRDIIRMGIDDVDDWCQHQHGQRFAALEESTRIRVLEQLDEGEIALDRVAASTFFEHFWTEVRTGYFADPQHGANRDMAAWKAIGYPGVRADYLDWIEVRDQAYPLPPVDLHGNRG